MTAVVQLTAVAWSWSRRPGGAAEHRGVQAHGQHHQRSPQRWQSEPGAWWTFPVRPHRGLLSPMCGPYVSRAATRKCLCCGGRVLSRTGRLPARSAAAADRPGRQEHVGRRRVVGRVVGRVVARRGSRGGSGRRGLRRGVLDLDQVVVVRAMLLLDGGGRIRRDPPTSGRTCRGRWPRKGLVIPNAGNWIMTMLPSCPAGGSSCTATPIGIISSVSRLLTLAPGPGLIPGPAG